jgi:hypothetical protein
MLIWTPAAFSVSIHSPLVNCPGSTGRRNEVSDHILLPKSSKQCSLTRMRQKAALDAEREAG